MSSVLAACGGGGGGSNMPQSYTVGGTVSGLTGSSGLTLQDSSSGTLTVSANGTFTMPKPVASGASYSVTVSQQPASSTQICTVSGGSGVIGSANVTSIKVACNTGITSVNAPAVTMLGNNIGETVLQLASFLGERLRYLSTHLGATATETCSDPYNEFPGGTAVYTFEDSDGSGTLTAGDVVTITLANCKSPSLADNASGTIRLELVAPSHATAGGSAFASTATLNSLALSALTITGSISAEYDFADTEYNVFTSVSSTPLQLKYLSGGFFPVDNVSVSNVSASKTIDYTQPRYSVQIAETFASQTLNGTFTATTPQALAGRLNVYPDAGMETFTAGPSILHYAAQNTSSNEAVAVELDADGSGTFDQLPGSFWEAGVNGFLWWEPRGFSIVSANQRPSYSTAQLGQWQMLLMFTEPQQADPINQILSNGMDVDTPIKLFFSGPVNPSSAVFEFDTAGYQIPGQVVIPAVPVVNGPIVTITAQTQLQHGELYSLEGPTYITTTWPTGGAGALVRLQLTTLNNLQAAAAPSPGVAAPGQIVSLVSTGSVAASGPIAHYLWTQTSGPAATLSNASSATASFAVPAGAQSGDSLHFTLTITDQNGETDSVPVTMFVLTDLTQPFVYYRGGQLPNVGQTLELATFESTANGTVSTEYVAPGPPAEFKFIYNASGPNFDLLQWMPGTSTIATGSYSSAATPGGNPLFLWLYQCSTSSTTWQMTIYESQGAPDGTAEKFAADFSMSCSDNSMPPLNGSVRVNSTVPLP
jgi:hypothetical protein